MKPTVADLKIITVSDTWKTMTKTMIMTIRNTKTMTKTKLSRPRMAGLSMMNSLSDLFNVVRSKLRQDDQGRVQTYSC